MSKFTEHILRETGAMDANGKTRIKNIIYKNELWVIVYKRKHLIADGFTFFDDLYNFLIADSTGN